MALPLHELHAKLYDTMPVDTEIHVWGLNDVQLVSKNLVEVAQALGHTGGALEAAQEGDAWYINRDLVKQLETLVDEFGITDEV